jgi:hypothetical protein
MCVLRVQMNACSNIERVTALVLWTMYAEFTVHAIEMRSRVQMQAGRFVLLSTVHSETIVHPMEIRRHVQVSNEFSMLVSSATLIGIIVRFIETHLRV